MFYLFDRNHLKIIEDAIDDILNVHKIESVSL